MFKLTPEEASTPLWVKMKEHYTQQLHLLRAQNDTDKPQEQTAKLRGRIAEIKILLALDSPAPVMEADDAE